VGNTHQQEESLKPPNKKERSFGESMSKPNMKTPKGYRFLAQQGTAGPAAFAWVGNSTSLEQEKTQTSTKTIILGARENLI